MAGMIKNCSSCPAIFWTKDPRNRECRRCSASKPHDPAWVPRGQRKPDQKKRKPDQKNKSRSIPSGTVGAIAELAVSAHLLSLGYHVYRSLSPCAPCDIIAIKGPDTRYIEVRTGSIRPKDGKLSFSQKHYSIVTHFAIYIPSTKRIIFIPRGKEHDRFSKDMRVIATASPEDAEAL